MLKCKNVKLETSKCGKFYSNENVIEDGECKEITVKGRRKEGKSALGVRTGRKLEKSQNLVRILKA